MKPILSLFLAIILLASCSKESISPTQGQITAAKLKSALGPYQFSNVTAYSNNTYVITGSGYQITDDGFIKVDNINFSLDQLKFYQATPPSLTLYF